LSFKESLDKEVSNKLIDIEKTILK
jgi:hypothetical protein